MLGCVQFLTQRPQSLSISFQGGGLFKKLAMILVLPLYPLYIIIQDLILTETSKDYAISVTLMEEAKFFSAQFLQVEIGLESHLQLILSITLLLLASSKTKTITGLEVLFENENFFYLNTKLALLLSISLSLLSCIKSQFKGISKKRQHSTTLASVLFIVYTSTSIVLRVFSCILYLTPALGLFDLLRHMQGEMLPYWDPYFYPEDIYTFNFYFGDAPPLNWTDITRWNYIESGIAEPPQLTLYTYFTIEQYLGFFICIFALQFVFHLALKIQTNPLVFQKLSWIDCVVHILSCCFIPCPMEEWDTEKGTVEMHKARKHLVFKEMMAAMMVNFGFNILMLTPLVIVGKYHMHM